MITEARATTLIDTALRHGKRHADGIEVIVTSSDIATSRFANNEMTQNQSPERTEVSIRLLKGGRQIRLSTDNITPANIRRMVDEALELVEYLQPDKSLLPLLSSREARKPGAVKRFDRATANFTADDRAAQIKRITDIARKSNLISAGVYATGSTLFAIGNSRGLVRAHRETSAECSITMLHRDAQGGESTGWSKEHQVAAHLIDTGALARRAADKALASANPTEVEPGKYTVILEPSAVADLVAFIYSDFTATSHQDKLSCFLGQLGKQVLGTNISIVDDVYHPEQAGAPFDGEGVARQVVPLVDKGVIANLVYGRKAAQQMKAQCTGHGLPQPSAEGEYPVNIVLSGGETSLEEMIKTTKRGILLTRVWYIRDVDQTRKIVTGMTRDGTFLVEDGAIKGGIKNMRFNQSLLDLLNNVVALGPSHRTAGEESFPTVVPALKVDGFNFASVTRF